jgi:hypothetical protein
MSRVPSRLVRRYNHTPSQYDVLTPAEWDQLFALAEVNNWSPYAAVTISTSWLDEILRPPPDSTSYSIDGFVHFLAIFANQNTRPFTVKWHDTVLKSSDYFDHETWTYFCFLPNYPASGTSQISVRVINLGTRNVDPQQRTAFVLPDPLTSSTVSLEFEAASSATPLCRLVARVFTPDS